MSTKILASKHDFVVRLNKEYRRDIIKIQDAYTSGRIAREKNNFTLVKVDAFYVGANTSPLLAVMNNHDLYVDAFINESGFFRFSSYEGFSPSENVREIPMNTNYNTLLRVGEDDTLCGIKINNYLSELAKYQIKSEYFSAYMRAAMRALIFVLPEAIRCRTVRDDIDGLLNRHGHRLIDHKLKHVLDRARSWGAISESPYAGSVVVEKVS